MPTVMVIDDSEDFRAYLSALLQRQGYDVIALENGSDLPQQVKEHAIDAVITDLYMPQVDGLEVVSFFARFDQQIPVFGVTGSPGVGPGPCIRAMNTFGAREVFSKPIDSARLITCLAEVVKASPTANAQGVLDLGLPDLGPEPDGERR